MNPNDQTLNIFETRVRQMILQFQQLKKENESLQLQVAENEQEIKNLQDKLNQADNDYQALKTAKMMEITDGDLERAKARLAKLIREVNKSITLLSNDQ